MMVGYYKVICSVECTCGKLSTIVRVSVYPFTNTTKSIPQTQTQLSAVENTKEKLKYLNKYSVST